VEGLVTRWPLVLLDLELFYDFHCLKRSLIFSDQNSDLNLPGRVQTLISAAVPGMMEWPSLQDFGLEGTLLKVPLLFLFLVSHHLLAPNPLVGQEIEGVHRSGISVPSSLRELPLGGLGLHYKILRFV